MNFREIVRRRMTERSIPTRRLARYLANGDEGKTKTYHTHIRMWFSGEAGIKMSFLQDILKALDLEIVIKDLKVDVS